MNELVSVGLSGTPYEIKYITKFPKNFESNIPINQVSLYSIINKETGRIVDVVYVHNIQCFAKKEFEVIEKISFYAVSETPHIDRISISDPIFVSFDLVIEHLTSLCEKQKTKVV